MKNLLFTLALLLAVCSVSFAQPNKYIVAENNEKVDENAPLEYAIRNGEVQTGSSIAFAKNSAKILPTSTRALKTIKKYLDEKSYITTLRIEGHVECGDGAQRLSEERALAVCNWLIAAGIDCKRVIPIGFGCTKPMSDIFNERITFVNAALRDRPIGGMPLDGGGKMAGDPCSQ